MLINFKDEDFENKIKKEDVSIILFSAIWCTPCKTYRPVLEKVSNEYKDRANFYYADIEEGGINVASQLGLRSVPVTVVMKKGTEVERLIGGVPEGHLKEFLDKNI